MKIYNTKYSLTKGILLQEGELLMGNVVRVGEGPYATYLPSNDWHTTKEAAIARAEQMRDNKIASLKKQLKRLEEMGFLL